MLNQSQVAAIVRWVITVLGGIGVSKGLLTNDDVNGLTTDILGMIGPIAALATLAWSIWAHMRNQKIASTAALPDVRKIVTTAEIADAIPSNKVTT